MARIQDADWPLAYLREQSTGFAAGYRAGAKRRLSWLRRSGYLSSFSTGIANSIRHRRADIAPVAFATSWFPDILTSLGKNSEVGMLVRSSRELILAFQSRSKAVSMMDVRVLVDRASLSSSSNDARALTNRAVAAAGRKLEALGSSVIVLGTDSLPYERVLVLASRELGISTICIQHGVFLPNKRPTLFDGFGVTHMLLWGSFFTSVYPSDMGNLSVLCYPHSVSHRYDTLTPPPENGIVCFLGQPFAVYDKGVTDTYRSIVEATRVGVISAGLRFVYRPHPAERRRDAQRSLRGTAFTPRAESLSEALDRYDAFTSISSTALVQAALLGKPAVQLRDEAFGNHDFELYGACRSAEARDSDSINHKLSHQLGISAQGLRYPTDHFMATNPYPGEVFRDWLSRELLL